MDRAALLVHGRNSHEGGPRAANRKRIILTRRIAAIALEPAYPHALLWNPAGASLQQAVAAIAPGDGAVAVIGGTEVFGMFLPLYDAFHLTRAAQARIPGGRPLFPQMRPDTTAENVLAQHGLHVQEHRDLDSAAGVSLTTFVRSPS